jgi:hypothetical protein
MPTGATMSALRRDRAHPRAVFVDVGRVALLAVDADVEAT